MAGDDADGDGRPDRCPGCGRSGTLQPRYTTGGGWRVVAFRCRVCGRLVPRRRR